MKTLLLVLATLALGLWVGVNFEKHHSMGVSAPPTAPDTFASAVSGPALPAAGTWDPFSEMRRMQADMDRMFSQSVARFSGEPQFSGLVDAPGYSLSLDVRELGNRFEVRAALPDAKASDISVKLDGDRTLDVTVSHKTAEKSALASTEEWGKYMQTIELPAAVQADKMKVERMNHELLITLPKA